MEIVASRPQYLGWERKMIDAGFGGLLGPGFHSFAVFQSSTFDDYGSLNIMQAAALDIGRNDYQRWKADNFSKIVVGWTGIGAVAPFLTVAAISAGPALVTSFLGNPVAWTEGAGALTMGAAGYESELPTARIFSSKAATQVTPGITELSGQYIDDLGRVQPWKASYDQFGRLIERTDWNAANKAHSIDAIHHHTYEYLPKGQMNITDHIPGVGPNTN
jgi:hypothetical protein